MIHSSLHGCEQGIILAPVLGYWMDRRGSLGIMVLSSFMCALGCFLRGIAQSVTHLYLAAIVLGLGGGALDFVVSTPKPSFNGVRMKDDDPIPADLELCLHHQRC